MQPLEGKVAWVAGVGEGANGVGHAVALLLAAGGARVLVSGANERALGECVGEIAHAGGQARHKVADFRAVEAARACVAAALERFGVLDIVVMAPRGSLVDAETLVSLDAVHESMRPGGRIVVALAARDDRVPEELAELVAFVCGPACEQMSGEILTVT